MAQHARPELVRMGGDPGGARVGIELDDHERATAAHDAAKLTQRVVAILHVPDRGQADRHVARRGRQGQRLAGGAHDVHPGDWLGVVPARVDSEDGEVPMARCGAGGKRPRAGPEVEQSPSRRQTGKSVEEAVVEVPESWAFGGGVAPGAPALERVAVQEAVQTKAEPDCQCHGWSIRGQAAFRCCGAIYSTHADDDR
jgi:hypothetical protein